MSRAWAWLRARGAPIRYRLLLVNLLVLLVPVAGLEFARIYERQLLNALEQDMRNQAVLVRRQIEADPDFGPGAYQVYEAQLRRAARDTRMRIRVLDGTGHEVVDSHDAGPPEGPEPPVPTLLPESAAYVSDSFSGRHWRAERAQTPLHARPEVTRALRGKRAAFTRVGPEAVYLFVTEPVQRGGAVVAVVYVIRSTRPVLLGLYRIRNGLVRVVGGAVAVSVLLTLLLAWTISRPVGQLARAAKRIAAGEQGVEIPLAAGGELRELGEALRVMTGRQAERMRDRAEFAADVAHEFKSPLTSIRGAAELLGEGALDDPEARARFLRNIELDSERLARLVSRLLELGRVEAAEQLPTTFDWPALVARAVARAETPEVAIEVHDRAGVHMVRGREADLETALVNLLDNAVRHAPAGSSVALSVYAGDGAGQLVVRVRDRGAGVPEHQRERIFQRFFTTDEGTDGAGGSGLGLAIAASVAHSHGGSLRLLPAEDTAGGKGACFELRLCLPV